jgi:hypothetical protein
MALAGARRAQEVDHLAAGDEAELGQGEDAVPVERGLEGEVEAGEGLDRRQAAHAQGRLDAAVLPQGQLFGEQDIDGLQGTDLALLEAPHDVIERLQRTRHLQAHQIIADAIEHRGAQLSGGAHARLSWASWRATAS